MTKYIISTITPLLIAVFLITACRKNELIDDTTVIQDPVKILVVSSFKGKVTDESGNPISGATVTIHETSTTTASNGTYVFQNIKANKGATLVTVEKGGFFKGSTMASNNSGGQNYSKVTMLPKGVPQTVNAIQGGTLNFPNGLKLQIEPNTLRRANGSLYTGDAKVYSRVMDPTSANFGQIMPGSLMARDETKAEKVLSTFGMAVVELEDSNGEELILKDEDKIKLELPIPPDLLGGAPDPLGLWVFDVEQERWLYNGICTKNGSVYVCSVGGSCSVACAVGKEPICLSGTFFQSDSTPAYFTKVIVTDLTDNFTYYGYTDINGYFCGSVPKGTALKITLEDLCTNVLYEANIGPFSMDTNLGQIYLDETLNQYYINIVGTLNNCNNEPVTTGQISIQYPGKLRVYPVDASGNFDINLALNCIEFPQLQITGHDLSNSKSTEIQLYSDTSDLDLGVLTACTSLNDSMTILIDNVPTSFTPTRYYFQTNVSTNWLVMEGLTVGGNISIELRQYTGVGTYTNNAFLHLVDYPANPNFANMNSSSPDITVNITQDDTDFIIGNLSGVAFDAQNNAHTVECNFKVKKEF